MQDTESSLHLHLDVGNIQSCIEVTVLPFQWSCDPWVRL